jgi:hypothetical protein
VSHPKFKAAVFSLAISPLSAETPDSDPICLMGLSIIPISFPLCFEMIVIHLLAGVGVASSISTIGEYTA